MRDRHAIIATLLFAALRAQELCQLRWREIDLPSARLHVTRSKTDAGRRTIDLLPILRATLTAQRDRSLATADDLVFPAGTGRQRNKDNLRNGVHQPTNPVAVMAQLGHTDPHFTLRTYAHAMPRVAEGDHLGSTVRGSWVWTADHARGESARRPR